jgi:CDP-diacylglycerol--glycerol-3-phosphate 3-phosphatidyltransferase
MAGFIFLSDKNRERYLGAIAPVGEFMARLGVHPNMLTLSGLILSGIAGLFYSTGSFFWGAWLVVLAGTCDVLDGHLAKKTGKASRFGAFLDSTLDRFGEALIFMGLAWYYAKIPLPLTHDGEKLGIFSGPLVVVFVFLAMAGSFMVSYTRARAEGLGIYCKGGWMQRPERITLLVIGSLLGSCPVVGHFLMELTLLLLAALSNFTALQRIMYVKKQLLNENQDQ